MRDRDLLLLLPVNFMTPAGYLLWGRGSGLGLNQLPFLFRKYDNITCYFTISNITIEKLNSLITENVLYKVSNFCTGECINFYVQHETVTASL